MDKQETPPPSSPQAINPTPKQQFLAKGTWISDHRRMVDSEVFQRAIDHASRHYVRSLHGIAPTDLTHPNFMAASAMNFQRIQGMHDFIQVLLCLSEVVKKTESVKLSDNLDN
jgi:hypothetical protein